MEIPETHYAQSRHLHIAYQIFGQAGRDMVLLPNWFTNVESSWDIPVFARFFRAGPGPGQRVSVPFPRHATRIEGGDPGPDDEGRGSTEPVRLVAPSSTEAELDALARQQRLVASPRKAATMISMMVETDVRDALASV